MTSTSTVDLSTIPPEALHRELGATPDGLALHDAAARLVADGANEVAERRRNPVLTFVGYFWAPIQWMIEAALLLSLAARHWIDAVIIGVAVGHERRGGLHRGTAGR